ncbi:MAG: LD-carboxypeptidase [Clostridia bacterium]|nr:LD-carboxypeptidase [Clostridia bacterium]
MIVAEKLKKGDTIGIVSPSSCLGGLVQRRFYQGVRKLEDLGFHVIVAPHALDVTGYTAGSAKERAGDIMAFFKNPKVKAIICSIGGFHSNELLKELDFDVIRENPKIFVGYSDATVLHFAFYTQCGLVTYYGPSVMNQLADLTDINDYSMEYFQKALMQEEAIGEVQPSEFWSDELLDWFGEEDLHRKRKVFTNYGYEWLKPGKAESTVMGGCIESMLHLRGTKYWPDFNKKIFLWEIAERSEDITKGKEVSIIDSYLTDLELSGVFSQISGMVIGRPYGYTEEETEELKKIILRKTEEYSFPILFNVNVGHADPIMTLPLGGKVKLDSERNLFYCE